MALISPEPADKTEHLRLLLGLANDANHVQTTMDGPTGLAFHVPQYLADLYELAMGFQVGEEPTANEPTDVPVKRKPGRPRKNTDS